MKFLKKETSELDSGVYQSISALHYYVKKLSVKKLSEVS